jgi:shikimate dehydrogenase
LGGGGAAAGVLGPLLQAGPAHISVANRTLHKASELVARHLPLAARHHTELEAHTLHGLGDPFDVVINGTATSLSDDVPPLPPGLYADGALAYDMMYGPGAQGFMDWARAHGAQPRDGLGMLVEQAAEAFLIWRGVRPPSAQVLAELHKVIQG